MREVSLLTQISAFGVNAAAVLPVADIHFDRSFLALCEQNACGNYGACWMCPPDVGNIDTLIAAAKQFHRAVVYQTIGSLADSYDFDGMMAAAQRHNLLTQRISMLLRSSQRPPALHLSAGGCHVCKICAKRTQEPCRRPDLAIASLETYGVDVSRLATACGLDYINGQNTVTYFGAVLYME